MATVGLILAGAIAVALGSMLNSRRADPMGMFGLPTVCAIACRATKARRGAIAQVRPMPRRHEQEAA